MNKTIPVTTNFDQKPIGKLTLLSDVVVPWGSCFALGGIVKETGPDGEIKDYELVEISLISDDNYLNYLKAYPKKDIVHIDNLHKISMKQDVISKTLRWFKTVFSRQ